MAPREVRQPEVARLAALLLALVLVLPVAQAGHTALVAGAFLVELLSQGRYAPLSALTSAPAREALAVPGVAADRYVPAGLGAGRRLVLVHGATAEGKDDPRLREAAELLARSGFDVAVPTVPGLTRGRLRPEDVGAVVATLAARPGPAVVLGVSVGSGPALLAAADPSVRDRVSAVVSLGGYASALEVVRFWLTGTYEYGGVRGRVARDPRLVGEFVRANADLLDPRARAELMTGDPERAARFLAALPPDLRRYLDSMSPLGVAREIPGRLVLVHGRGDPTVPYTESLRLAAARPGNTTLLLVGILEHVEGGGGRTGRQDARDLFELWRAMYALLAG
ncbi:MAG TPA: alpha/beta fold hydrolase [Methylomirabilota bacterium]|nr:alpha/beta fold hydrolase [Methylomirabilota bacterium]